MEPSQINNGDRNGEWEIMKQAFIERSNGQRMIVTKYKVKKTGKKSCTAAAFISYSHHS